MSERERERKELGQAREKEREIDRERKINKRDKKRETPFVRQLYVNKVVLKEMKGA